MSFQTFKPFDRVCRGFFLSNKRLASGRHLWSLIYLKAFIKLNYSKQFRFQRIAKP